MINFLYNWQALIGASIGASIPLFFWFFIQWYEDYRKYRENLLYVEKITRNLIANVSDTHKTVKKYFESHFQVLLKNIKEDTSNNRYSIASAFFPDFYVFHIDENILKISTKSGYLDIQILNLLGISKDFALCVAQFKNEYKELIELNREMTFGKYNSFVVQNDCYIKQLKEFELAVNRDLLNINIPIFLKALVTTQVATNTIQRKGIILWRFKFSSSFRYFSKKILFLEFKKNILSRVDSSLEKEVAEQIKRLDEYISTP